MPSLDDSPVTAVRPGGRLDRSARTYDLRHAAVSTQLNAGISPTQVAEWAGQSPEVLWRNYAKCLDGGQAEVRRRVEAGYGGPSQPSCRAKSGWRPQE